MPKKIQLLNASQIDTKLSRLAYELYENNIHETHITLAGIADRGMIIAKQLKKKLEKISPLVIELITIIIDKANPIECHLLQEFAPEHKNIIVVDDVANSGKTMLYALKPFLAVVPAKIQIAVLIDRKHKLFPISSDYIGLQLSTTLQEQIIVEVEKEKLLGAYLC